MKTMLLLVISMAVYAQPVYVDVSQCRNITVDLARVACYDNLADIAMKRNGPSSVNNENSEPQANLNDQLREKNREMRAELARLRKQGAAGGSDAERMEQFGKPQRIVKNKDGEDILYGRIKSLQRSQSGWVITLDSGQVWHQKYTKAYRLKEGQQVKISPSSWGGYRLTVSELGSFIRVERIR